MSKGHVIGSVKDLLRALKEAGYANLEVGPLVGSGLRRWVTIADLEPAVDAAGGMIVTFQITGDSFEVFSSDGVLLATLAMSS